MSRSGAVPCWESLVTGAFEARDGQPNIYLPARPSQHNPRRCASPGACGARAETRGQGCSRAPTAHPLPVPCRGPRRGPGMGPQAVPLGAAPFPEGRRSSPGALHARPARGPAAPERPALGPALHHGCAGRCTRKCRSPPRLAPLALTSPGEIY